MKKERRKYYAREFDRFMVEEGLKQSDRDALEKAFRAGRIAAECDPFKPDKPRAHRYNYVPNWV